MAARIDVQLIDGLGLGYAPGAEAGLADAALDPAFHAAWLGFVALFPGQTLAPRFDQLTVEELADLVDGVRISGQEPPDPFVWFTLTCDDNEADDMAAALMTLPMVSFAARRPLTFLPEGISYGTNPRAALGQTLQIRPAPLGVDAIYAWQIPGGAGDDLRIADIEQGWRLDHEELLTARITRRSVFGRPSQKDIDHGTAVAGIVVGSDNGVGTLGIVPNASFELITTMRANGEHDLAGAISLAARTLTEGDILLLEAALNFFERPKPEDGEPDMLVEFDPTVQLQIRLAVGRGITVIEPAGNAGTVNLDQFPFLAHTRPESPTFSGAIVVGSAQDSDPPDGNWSRVSAFGSRVDCFAAGANIQSPEATRTDTYQEFGGTSGASAIIAGVAASLQAMTKATSKGNKLLKPADIRRLLGTARLGTLPLDPLNAKIGSMPDLRKITQAQGLHRILPVGAAAIGGNSLLMVQLDANNRMVRRHFTLLTGWGQPVPTPTVDGSVAIADQFALTAAQPAVLSSDETNPVARLVHDAFFSGRSGVHRMFWDSFNLAGNLVVPIAPRTAAAQGHALAAVRPRLELFALAAINPEGRLVVITGDPQKSSASAPVVLDAVGSYRRVAGPALVSRGVGLADVVAIEDGGSLNWFTLTLNPITGMTFSGPVTEPSAVTFDPGARPALISTGSLLLAAAVGTDGSLRVASIDPVLLTMDTPIEVDRSVPLARSGPVALGRTASNVVILAVGADSRLRAATRPIAGGAFTPLIELFSLSELSPLGGVTVVSLDLGVMALAVGTDGVVCSALSVDGIVWSPLLPLP